MTGPLIAFFSSGNVLLQPLTFWDSESLCDISQSSIVDDSASTTVVGFICLVPRSIFSSHGLFFLVIELWFAVVEIDACSVSLEECFVDVLRRCESFSFRSVVGFS